MRKEIIEVVPREAGEFLGVVTEIGEKTGPLKKEVEEFILNRPFWILANPPRYRLRCCIRREEILPNPEEGRPGVSGPRIMTLTYLTVEKLTGSVEENYLEYLKGTRPGYLGTELPKDFFDFVPDGEEVEEDGTQD